MELLHACALSVQRVFRGSLGRAIHRAEGKRQYWEIRVRQAVVACMLVGLRVSSARDSAVLLSFN